MGQVIMTQQGAGLRTPSPETVTPETHSPEVPVPTAQVPEARNARLSLIGLTREELGQALLDIGIAPGERRMRVAQLWSAFYVAGHDRFEEITTLSKRLRQKLDMHFSLARPEIVSELLSTDGTRKWLIRLPSTDPRAPSPEVECVYIPEPDRGTLCISSQVGCTLNCTFCHTGTQKWVRNLTAGEIVAQILIARDALDAWPGGGVSHPGRPVTNIVLMGMGEPLYNFDNVRQAVDILADGEGLSVSRRRITLSTSGVVPMLERVGREIGCMLAISLHGVNDAVRTRLVPLNKTYPLKDLLEACRAFPGVSNARRITFEYVMLKDVNDSPEEAHALVRLLKGIPAKINLIPFNPWPGSPYVCSDADRIEAFARIINKAGYASPVRKPRGRDIMAACGQLKSVSEKRKASALAR